jgi:RNA polymerase sigma-70 factor (ECF subfamily)
MEQANTPARERFEALFERYHADVAAYVRRRAPDSVVEDVVGETFLIAWRALERLRDDPAPWLYGVARRVSPTIKRRRRRRGALTARLAREHEHPQERAALAADVSESVRGVSVTTDRIAHRAWRGLESRSFGCRRS